MPFREYQLATLTAAFDAVWQELSVTHTNLTTEEKVALLRKKLVQRILVSATAGGVRDLETLKEQALRSLGGGFQLRDEQICPDGAA